MAKVFRGKYIEVKCLNCNEQFVKRSEEIKKYSNHYCCLLCVRQHKTKLKNVKLICQICSRKYIIKKSIVDKSKYCSKKCKIESQKTAKRECVDCGTELKSYTAKRCYPCARLYLTKTREPRVKKIGYVTIVCDYCNEEHQQKRVNHSKDAKHHYCNKKCEGLHRREIMPRGENHWLYKGTTPLNQGIRLLSAYKDWRTAIFEQDDYECVRCEEKGYLEAHHKIRFTDMIEKYNITTIEEALLCLPLWDANNGETLCVDCHKKERKNRRAS